MTSPPTRWSRDLAARDDIRRILAIRWTAMGDVVIASATFQELRDAFPEAEIHLNVFAPWSELFREDPRFSKVMDADLRARGRRFAKKLAWLREVHAERYDLVVDLHCNDLTRILLVLLHMMPGKIPYRAGYHRRFPYNIAPDRPRQHPHVFDRARSLLRAMGVQPRQERPVLHASRATLERTATLLEEHGLRRENYVVFLPGCQAAGYLKRWGAARYAELARRLAGRGIERVALVGGSEEMKECARIQALEPNAVVNLCGLTELTDVAPICEGARLVVANDTGTGHLASVNDVPILVICGPTDPNRVKPLGRNVRTLQADLPCINCYRKTCSHHSCMVELIPELVEAEALRCLGRRD